MSITDCGNPPGRTPRHSTEAGEATHSVVAIVDGAVTGLPRRSSASVSSSRRQISITADGAVASSSPCPSLATPATSATSAGWPPGMPGPPRAPHPNSARARLLQRPVCCSALKDVLDQRAGHHAQRHQAPQQQRYCQPPTGQHLPPTGDTATTRARSAPCKDTSQGSTPGFASPRWSWPAREVCSGLRRGA